MGVPKFYRWISERYPCLSEVVKEHQVPEFDNLYLDMNGIIHTCSHPNDEDPHFRITEEQIFKDIFSYIEALFRIIRPRKTFFMAVDGVAPRAKMNQQRGRRFRSAKDAEEKIKIAKMKGEILPNEKRFDSNCITPGTKFMEKLQTQLEYFVQSKITFDQTWQGIEVYLSGHQTPGEGEHKIMEFIRYQRSQAGYDPNTRHCLYGLDADLMMLALCSHEPHFALLREEVKFTKRKNDKRTSRAEETTFHLLHISLMREYIDHEFESLKSSISFVYDIESIIDDWVLMGFLVGNDFIPHLPNFHISSNALPLLYQTYIDVLPTLDGYINEGGAVNLERFQAFLKAVSSFDEDHFEEIYEDYKWLESKRKTKKVLQEVVDEDEQKSIQIVKDLAISQGVYSISDNDSQEDSISSDPFYKEFKCHKRNYYSEKFHVTPSDEQIQCIAYEYVLGIQWICHYYYNGVQSWSWYYPYHYSPYVSDIKNVATMKLKFKMNKPFLPYEQLLAVLPAASKDCIPEPYWHLMDESSSIIGDFYPTNFETDLNGKKQEWEAVVLIPFIDETRLLKAMQPCFQHLSKPERVRNQHGPCQLYVYDRNTSHLVKSTLPAVFPDIATCFTRRTNIPLNLWSKLALSSIIKGLLPGCDLSVYIQGFSTLYHLPHTACLSKQAVKVFQAPSRNENMILEISYITEVDGAFAGKYATLGNILDQSLEEIAQKLLGKSVYVNWPHMEEAKVVAASDGTTKFFLQEQVTGSRGSKHKFGRKELSESEAEEYMVEVHSIRERWLNRRGINVGDTKVILYAQVLLGCKYVCGRRGEITLEKQWSAIPQPFAIQTTVKELAVKGPTFEKIRTLQDLLPKDADVFNISFPHYGSLGRVVRIKDGNAVVKLNIVKEPVLTSVIQSSNKLSVYLPGFKAARIIGITPYLLSRITGSLYIYFPEQQKWNVGLSLKFTKENSGILGYTKRKDGNWFYSTAACEVIQSYMERYSQIFTYLEKVLTNGNESQLNAEDVFGSENTLADLSALSEWLKSLPCAKSRKINEKSNAVNASIVQAVNEAVTSFKNVRTRTKLEVQLCIRPHLLYRPMTQQGSLVPDKNAKHCLLDRIVNVRMGYIVPLGYRGTIIGIHEEGDTSDDLMYEVLFDEEFLGGSTLSGQCPERRGYKLPACALINLSFGERVLNRNSNRPVAVVKPHHQEQLNRGENPYYSPQFKQPASAQFVSKPARFVPSTNSAFSPARKLYHTPSRPGVVAQSTARISEVSHVHSIKTKSNPNINPHATSNKFRRDQGSPSPKLVSGRTTQKDSYRPRRSSNLSETTGSSNTSFSLDQAAKWLPKIDPLSKSKSPDVRTIRASSSRQRIPKGMLAIQTKTASSDEGLSKNSPAGTVPQPPVQSNTDLTNALKTTLRISTDDHAEQPTRAEPTNDDLISVGASTSRADLEKKELDKLLATLKPFPLPPPTNQFSLKDILFSQQMQQSYPQSELLRPDTLIAESGGTSQTMQIYSDNTYQADNQKEGADKLWELLNVNNGDDENELKKKKPDHAWSINDIVEKGEPEKNEGKTERILEETNEANNSPLSSQEYSNEKSLRSSPDPSEEDDNVEFSLPSSTIASVSSIDNSSATSSSTTSQVSTSLSHISGVLNPISAQQFYVKDGNPLLPPPYFVGHPPPTIPPSLAVSGVHQPPLNFMPMPSDGMIFYPPPPILPYGYPSVAPRFYPVSGSNVVGSPYLPSVVPSSNIPYNMRNPLISRQAGFYPPHPISTHAAPLGVSQIPFIPSQVISQHYASISGVSNSNDNKPSNSSSTTLTHVNRLSVPTSTSGPKSSGKKPKPKLAISFTPQSK